MSTSEVDVVRQLAMLNATMKQIAEDVRWIRQREEKKDKALAEATAGALESLRGMKTGG